MILYHTNIKYDNILDKIAFQRSMVKLNVTVDIFRKKHCHRSSVLIYYTISIQLHTSIRYDNTSNKFAFQHDRVKVAVTIFRKTFSSLYCLYFFTDFNFISHKCLV